MQGRLGFRASRTKGLSFQLVSDRVGENAVILPQLMIRYFEFL